MVLEPPMPDPAPSTESTARTDGSSSLSISRRTILTGSVLTAGLAAALPVKAVTPRLSTDVQHKRIRADGVDVFYREAGPTDAPVLLLLHGFANSSFYFRHLMPKLADRFRMIAPDLPSFG